MTRYALDSNVPLYAELEPDSEKGRRAARLIAAVADRGVLPAQAIGEFLNVVRRRRPAALAEARRQVEAYRAVFAVVPSDAETMLAAARFAERYDLQFWDSVIWQASVRGGASVLLSEDLQDGFEVDGMRVVDPFAAEDWKALARQLSLPGLG